ncbi:MAG: sulfatase-like hydrolase/transferase, partial [Bacteroidota bacterium]
EEKVLEQKGPNVIFIMMDDLGYGQFGIFNDTLTTQDYDPFFVKLVDSLQGYSLAKSLEFSKNAMPTLRKLSTNGILFNRAFTSSSLCAPSRAGIATGTSQNKWGLYTNMDVEKKGIEQGTHLAENLKKLQYNTAHIGKWHIGARDRKMVVDILEAKGLDANMKLSSIHKNYPEVAKEIRESGYIGSVVTEHHPLNNGFDYYYGYNHWASDYYNATNVWENFKHAGKQISYNTDTFTDKTLEFIASKKNDDHPFYIQLHYHAVHDSIEPTAPKKYLDKFKSDSHHLNNFYAHVNGVDANIKRIIDYLRENGLYENTMLVFTSDNGAMSAGSYDGHKTGSPLPGNAPFSGHKGNYYQGGIRVPLLLHWPDKIHQMGISNALVSTLDILPTAIDAAGGRVPYGIDGKSLLPLFDESGPEEVRESLIWAGIHSAAWGFMIQNSTKDHGSEREHAPPAWAVIQGDYLLRFTGELEPEIYLDNMEGRAPIFELYNLKRDPAESIDLSDSIPEKVLRLARTYFKDSKDFAPPPEWKLEKWEELINSKNLLNDKIKG